MLVGVEPATLAGYVQPVEGQPGFLLLIFRTPRSNQLLAQQIDASDRIVGFRAIEPPVLVETSKPALECKSGDTALWGYLLPGEPVCVGSREVVSEWLTPRIDKLADPLLRLQVAEFCALGQHAKVAWRQSFDHLAGVAPRSAYAWRDFVVLPARVREAVRCAVENNGLDADTANLSRDVCVEVENSRLTATFDERLFAKLRAHPTALSEISRDTADVRSAFAISPELVMRARQEMVVTAPQIAIGSVLVAIGNRGHAVVEKMIPTARKPRVRYSAASGPRSNQAGSPEVTVLLSDQLTYRGDITLETLAPHLPVSFEDRVFVLFVFGAGASEIDIVKQAARLADSVDRRYYRPIAVIPHLPDTALGQAAADYQELIVNLALGFEAICIISDHSPNLRGGMLYGPSRSIDGPAARLRHLIDRLSSGDIELIRPVSISDVAAVRVHLFSSVNDSGGLSDPRLLDHALTRMTEFSLDWAGRGEANIAFSAFGSASGRQTMEAILKREHFASFRAEHWAGSSLRERSRKAFLHLADARWSAFSLDAFEEYCRTELERCDWTVQPIDDSSADLLIRQGETSALVQCKIYGATSARNPFRVKHQRHLLEDMVILTDVAIQKNEFIRQMLDGRLPLHVSRISALNTIYTQRYDYLIRALLSQPEMYRRRVCGAAFDYLFQALGSGSAPAIVAAALPPDERADLAVEHDISYVEWLNDALRIELAVSKKNHSKPSTQTFLRIIMTGEGWHVEPCLISRR
jgi:hypothetical protein